MALFSLKQEAPASIGGSTFTTGKVVDLETTAALIPEITLMYHGEKYKFQDHVFIVKGGEDDSVKYLVYDELNDSLFCVVEKKLPNSQWLREKYRLVSSTEESKLKPYLRYIQNQHFTTFTLPRKLMKLVYTRPELSPLDFLRFGP